MSHQIIPTGDNSFTIYIPEMDETYHSRKGAIAESNFVYIQSGLAEKAKNQQSIKVFEFGFGTGLNALLTWEYATKNHIKIFFDSIEKFPLSEGIFTQLNYDVELNTSDRLLRLHQTPWNETVILSDYFILQKYHLDIVDFSFPESYYDVVYYDAFAPSKQEEVWDICIINNLYRSMADTGMLVTYCSQGNFKRNLISAGFKVEKIPGPPGKREMIKAHK